MAAWLRPTIGRFSAYTVLGVAGFVAAAVLSGALMHGLEMPLLQRLGLVFVPPLAFLATIRFARHRAGYERIVFYECVLSCLVTTILVALVLGAPVARSLDIVTVGIGVFLVFGRLGCLRVACCHGRPARRGVRYGRAHVNVGFPRVWQDRPVFPIQLVEAAVSLLLTIVAMMMLASPGAACAVYLAGYGVARFALEELRGDRDRKYIAGLSEAQRMALASTAVVAIAYPRVWTVAAAAVVLVGAILAFARRRAPDRRFLRPGHFHEMCGLLDEIAVMQSATTSEEITVTRYTLPDGRLDCVLSHPSELPVATARRVGTLMHFASEVVPGRTPNLVHILIPGPGDQPS